MSDKLFLNTGRSSFGFSRFQTFAQCPRKYAYDYISKEKVIYPFSKSLEKGSMVHIGLAHHYLDSNNYLNPQQAIKKYSSELIHGTEEEITECTDKSLIAIEQYIENYKEDKFEILHVEKEFEYYVAPARKMTQRVDLIYRDLETEEVVFCDHKTTSRYSESIKDNYRMSGQFIGYTMIAKQHFGISNPRILLNVIVLTKQIRFYRHFLQMSQNAIINYPKMICHIFNLMDNYSDTVDEYPMIITEFSCNGKYGKCPHFDKCST
jgi:hypothetical protein